MAAEDYLRMPHTKIRYCTCLHETVVATEETPRHSVLTVKSHEKFPISLLQSSQVYRRGAEILLAGFVCMYGASLKEALLSPQMM